jgi:hypothetical protein
VDDSEGPDNDPDSKQDPREEWQELNSQVLGNILGGGFLDCNSELDGRPAAANAEEFESSQSKQTISCILKPFIV